MKLIIENICFHLFLINDLYIVVNAWKEVSTLSVQMYKMYMIGTGNRLLHFKI